MTNSREGLMDRRQFFKLTGGSAAAMLLSQDCLSMTAGEGTQRPNFLWISCEDTGCELGCYGDAYAATPYLDELASQGVRYTNAFANAGVCAPARSCIITGMYPTTIGTHQMRCKGVPPVYVKAFSEYLRAAGYYCTNNQKTDYQFDSPPSAWDQCNGQAHYTNRAPGQPFFAVFNITISHESQIRNDDQWLRDMIERIGPHDPDKVPVPPYHPDTAIVRKDWAQYYDIVTLMDAEAGKLLAKLERDGLAEDTIVWFWGDHGAGMPRSKRWIYDLGIHVPLIIRVPEKYRKLTVPDNPDAMKPCSTCDQLVSFVDFASTMLSLAGIEIPEYMQGRPFDSAQGRAFLGPQKAEPRQYIFAHRDRMDERYDIIRAVRDKRYKYIRNYMPYVTRAQYIEYMDQMPTMQEMRRLYAAGKLKGAQLQYFEPTKPIEELYDISRDPHEVNNLADDPDFSDVLQRMRKAHDDWMKETGDVGLIPEPEFDEMKRPSGKWEKTDEPVFMSTPGKKEHITIACATAGASLLYRTEGIKQWKLYTNPVKLETPDKIEAKACRIGFEDSDVASFKSGDAFGTPAEKELQPHWRETLANSDLLERLRAIKELDYGEAGAINEYIEALGDKYASVRYWAVVGLHWKSGTAEEIERAKTAIGPLLDDSSPAVRIAAAEALCNWGEQDKALLALAELLRHRSGSVRLLGANALGAIGEKARPASADIKAALDDSDGDVVKVTRRTVELLKARSE